MTPKLLAEWFWTDRWMGSSAFLLPMEARGVYREMLTQAWRRGARLPNNHEAIQRAIGATTGEWMRAWPLLSSFWRVDGEHLINDTQVSIYREAADRMAATELRAKTAAQARWKNNPSNAQASNQAQPEQCPPSPSPSPSLISGSVSGGGKGKNAPPPDTRSKRPIFSGQRLTVFEWQLDDCSRLLGEHTDEFDLHAWFFTIDAMAVDQGLVIPKRDGGDWLQAQLLSEAQRRGLPLRMATVQKAGKLTTRMAEAIANARREEADVVRRLR